jgi:hypothetical protein
MKNTITLKFWVLGQRIKTKKDNLVRRINFQKAKLIFWWYGKFPQKDEFHHSYDFDFNYLLGATPEQEKFYRKEIVKRRRKAHELEIKEEKSSKIL